MAKKYIFQSTLPQGERPAPAPTETVYTSISIHAPTRGATMECQRTAFPFRYFNPRSHKGSDKFFRQRNNHLTISIHAPTRGATAIPPNCKNTCSFQSTLPQGERPRLSSIVKQERKISIHAPTRGATINLFRYLLMITISIHAPTRGATPSTSRNNYERNFNPRSHKGSDQLMRYMHQPTHISIHAPTRGATFFQSVDG